MKEVSTLRALSTFLQIATRSHRWRIFRVFLAESFFRSISLFGIFGLKLVVDAVQEQDPMKVWIAATIVAAPAGIQRFAGPAYIRAAQNMTEKVQTEVEVSLAHAVADPIGIEHQETPKHLDEINLVTGQRGMIAAMMRMLLTNFQAIITLGGSLFLLASVDPRVLFLPLVGIPAFMASKRAARFQEKASEANAERIRRRNHLFQISTSPEAGKELRVFGTVPEIMQRHRKLADAIRREIHAASWRSNSLRTGGGLLFAAGYIAAIALIIDRAAHDAASPGDVLMAMALAAQINGQVAGLAESGGTFTRIVTNAKRFLKLLDYAESTRQRPIGPAKMPDRLTGGLSLKNVGFSYPDSKQPAISDISFDIPAGSVVALVGENGAGKTTLIKLLLRMYEPQAGTIELDHMRLSDLDPIEWRSRVSTAFQDFVKFEFTMRESVGVGDLRSVDKSEMVLAALERAGASELVDVGPSGLETQLGRTWTDGIELSGGQWQKLALARALMRESPLLLVFDEPTSALDAETEHALFERFASATRTHRAEGMVTLLVSHRFSTVRMADVIVVMSEGRVVEIGPHSELMQRGGLYAELYELQAGAYR
ncbi:MAG TPA: ABC transporter ATP-binding protein [Actinomycetota bacterium]|nr:ABC transporter ATP-binding protein [Actinomycetota bacterium]